MLVYDAATGTEENRMRHAGVTNPMHTGTAGGVPMGQQIKVSQQVNILHCMYDVWSWNNCINWFISSMSYFGSCCPDIAAPAVSKLAGGGNKQMK